MKKVVIFCLCLCLCLFSCFTFSVFADTPSQQSQTIDLVTTIPTSVSLKTRYTSSDPWLTFDQDVEPYLAYYGGTFESYFPINPNNNQHCCIYSSYSGVGVVAGDLMYSETYSLPSFNFAFQDCYSSIVYAIELRTSSGTSDSSLTFSSANLSFLKSNGSTQAFSGLQVRRYVTTVNNLPTVVFIYQFDCDSVVLSSDITSFTFEFLFGNANTVANDNIVVRSNIFPFYVTTDYSIGELYSSATYDVINNNISPTLDNISQVVQSQAATASRALQLQEEQGIQASAAASAGMSQSVAQHSESMAAISSLPAAQADAQIAAAASAAQAAAAAEVSRDQATADSISNSMPDIAHFVNAPLAQFVNAFDDTGRTVLMEFPALQVPDFGHSGSVVTLTSSSIVDLSSWISWLESSQLGLYLISAARALITTGLLVYIVKVFISLVNYIISKGDLDDHIEDQIRSAEEFEETMSHLDYYKYDKRY